MKRAARGRPLLIRRERLAPPFTDQVGKAAEEIVGILWAGRCLRVMLDRENGPAGDRQAAIAAVEQGNVGFLDTFRQRVAIDRETMVHGNYLDLAGGEILHRMVRAVMALMHLDGFRAECERQHLVTEADTKDRDFRFKQLADHGHGVFGSGRRITRAVGEEYAIGLHGEDVGGAGSGGNHGHFRTEPARRRRMLRFAP